METTPRSELVEAARRIAALVPMSEAGETLTGLVAALEAADLQRLTDVWRLAVAIEQVKAFAHEFGAPGPIPTAPLTFDKGVRAALTDVLVRLEPADTDAALSEVRAKARADVVTEIRWLADARAEYSHVEDEVGAARHVADILVGENDAAGWLPSWKWDEWASIREGRA